MTLRRRLASLVVVLLAACASGSPESAGAKPGVECCALFVPYTSCGCMTYGGTKKNGVCPKICDTIPGGTYDTDENGCTVWHPGPGSCYPPPSWDSGTSAPDAPRILDDAALDDAGPDAGG